MTEISTEIMKINYKHKRFILLANWAFLLLTALVALGGCSLISSEPRLFEEVYITGYEQLVLDSFSRDVVNVPADEFDNDLELVFCNLLVRSHPPPNPNRLAQNTLDAMCRELYFQAGIEITQSERNDWVLDVLRTGRFEKVLQGLDSRAENPLDRVMIIRAGLEGMISRKEDPFARLIASDEAQKTRQRLENQKRETQTGFIGLTLTYWPMLEVLPNSPAEEAGIESGDFIISVDGRMVAGKSLYEGKQVFQGLAGQKANIKVSRKGEVLDFTVTRIASRAALIRYQVVKEGLLYIRVPTFEGGGCAKKLGDMLRHHRDRLSLVILDLRDNYAGPMQESNAIADMFLDREIFSIFQFQKGERVAFQSSEGAVEKEVFLLTNQRTSGAAELLVLFLKDKKGITVIGERTSGEFLRQDYLELDNGDLVVFQTEPMILSSQGNPLPPHGIIPDIQVKDAQYPGRDEILYRAIRLEGAYHEKK